MDHSQVIDLTPIAAEYGPFFFAVLFVLIVPLLGQQLIKMTVDSAGHVSAEELAERLSSRAAYRKFAIGMSIFLVLFSVVWWAAVQMWPPPTSQQAIDRKVNTLISSRVFEGVIRGGDDDDTFIDPENARYRQYVYPLRDRRPMLIRYVILFKDQPKKNEQIQLFYANRKTLEAMPVGYQPLSLAFCLNSAAENIRLLKKDGQEPRIEDNCAKAK